jgi:BirA family biotin operon repressor/biotin-[acetyl-CoA-carboxylase] ligase
MNANHLNFPIIRLSEVDSTNNYAMNLVRQGVARNFQCIWALHQNQGRGQRGNSWLSENGKNLTCSIIFFPLSLEATENFYLSMTVCLAAKRFLEKICNGVQIKWPNDIYLAGKKTGGILIENTLDKQNVKSSVIGVGINLNQSEFPADIPNATSVFLNSGIVQEIEPNLQLLYNSITEGLKKLDLKLYSEIKTEYLECLYGIGIQLKFKDSKGEFTGVIEGVEDTGELIIKDERGNKRIYAFKEVEMIP